MPAALPAGFPDSVTAAGSAAGIETEALVFTGIVMSQKNRSPSRRHLLVMVP
jgi:hypothetical protein